MSETTLYFLRHGETDYNRKGIVQGGGIDSVLNETGKQQAQAFFDFYQSHSFDAFYASTLQRTHQTLEPWRSKDIQLVQHHGLNEFNWGIHEGKLPTPEQRASFREILESWKAGDLHRKVEAGESPIEAWKRAEDFFEEIISKHIGKKVLICSHGRQLRVIFANLLGVGMNNMEQYSHHNTALSIIKIRPNNTGALEVFNNTTHLKDSGLNSI
ncbi:MAG: histidine phosphatase family protein [Bacteroidetes bacterium]|nr:histidine phosphatase family protein [Bacteroidota bacterium]MCB0845714.1 histidine phosphatase family protein [Bacteroidota bacterium]MCB0851567.1 histidine phosphatase family protein [Bacteroidota bacterium]